MAAHARRQPPERPTRDLDGVRIGWEREGERGRRRNVYTGLVGQSFLLRRSFAKAQTVFNEIISHERKEERKKEGKGTKKKKKEIKRKRGRNEKREKNRHTGIDSRRSNDDRSSYPRLRVNAPSVCVFALVSVVVFQRDIAYIVSYRIVSHRIASCRTVSLLPRTSSASGGAGG